MAKVHSTNYYNTLIEVAEDCPATESTIPPTKNKKMIANWQYEYLAEQPYQYTSDTILFNIHAQRKAIPEEELEAAKLAFFSKGQACFRASPLPKRYAWGIHSNADGKLALVAKRSESYQALLADENVKKVKAMRNKRG